MITEKAFPENETVIAGSINASGTPASARRSFYEQRIGASAMVEVAIPYDFTHESGDWGSAFGDLALGYKRKLFHSLKKGSIFSVGGEIIAPTGNTRSAPAGNPPSSKRSPRSDNCCPPTAFCRCTRASNCPRIPTRCPGPTTCEPRSARRSARTADSAAAGRRWWSSSPIAIWSAARRPTGTSCRKSRFRSASGCTFWAASASGFPSTTRRTGRSR